MSSIVNILWSGGWDSTYMLIQQLQKGKIVQPVYIVFNKRLINDLELKAMDTIRNNLLKINKFKDKILPIKFINERDIPDNQEITNSRNYLYEKYGLGIQYSTIAKYALMDKGIMLGLEKTPTKGAGITQAIRNDAKLVLDEDDVLVIDTNNSDKYINDLFGNIKFPILDITEVEMKEKLLEWNLLYIMDDVWFCYTPIDGKPCGVCHPCEQKISCGMGYLMSDEALNRYQIKKMINDKNINI